MGMMKLKAESWFCAAESYRLAHHQRSIHQKDDSVSLFILYLYPLRV
jgi:hypothetical protein